MSEEAQAPPVCTDCGEDCSCCDDSSPLRAMWLELNGEEIFAGIVAGPDFGGPLGMRKLDDPSPDAPLDGPGHAMDYDEFFSELALYDNSPPPSKEMVTVAALLDNEEDKPINPEDYDRFVESNMMAGIVDFSDKPEDFTDSDDSTFDVKFPFSEGPHYRKRLQVRAGDRVKIMAAGFTKNPDCDCHDPRCVRPFRERCWFHVISVTSSGMVTGASTKGDNHQHFCNLTKVETGLIAFPVTAVIGMTRGENW